MKRNNKNIKKLGGSPKRKWRLNFIILIIIIILQCGLSDFLYSFEDEPPEVETSGLYFTYIGLIAGYGINKIEYSNWFTDKRETKKISGNYFSGGILLDIFADNLIGEFSIQYINNSANGSPDISIQHVIYQALGKYSYSLNEYVGIAPGVGMYMETPPADRGYDGGGGLSASFGFLLNISLDYKIMLDATGRYGYFGMGEDSKKFSYGAKIGFLYSIGRI